MHRGIDVENAAYHVVQVACRQDALRQVRLPINPLGYSVQRELLDVFDPEVQQSAHDIGPFAGASA